MARVLVVDDDPVLSMTVSDFLQSNGHTVEVCETATRCLALLSKERYDLVITDWELPDMQGPELCQTYRAQGADLPTIMLSARIRVQDKRIGFDAGVDEYLTKPVDLDELLLRMEVLLRRAAQSMPHSKNSDTFGDNYEVLGEVGAGNMGTVLKGRHRVLNRMVAIKTMLRHSGTGQAEVARFQAEARSLSALDHPNIAKIYDFGFTEDRVPYLVMEYVEGTSLQELLERDGPMPEKAAVNLLIPIADALAYVHDVGLIHRDLKPANIMVARIGNSDVPKLIDFGLAKSLMPQGVEVQRLTAPGEIYGSPLYMSPEQCLAMDLDGRSDIYSFGCMMFELLSGRLPFIGNTVDETFMLRIVGSAPPLSQVCPDLTLDRRLEDCVMQALSREFTERQQTFHHLRNQLLAIRCY